MYAVACNFSNHDWCRVQLFYRVAGASVGRQCGISAWDHSRDWTELQGSWECQQTSSLKSFPCTKLPAAKWSRWTGIFIELWKSLWSYLSLIEYFLRSIKLHRLTEQDSRLTQHFALFLGLGLLLAYLATSDAKSDVIFLLSNPDFLQGWQNFAPISLSFRDLTWNRWQMQRLKQKDLIL